MDKDLEQKVHECHNCQQTRNDPPKAPLQGWHQAETPWSRLHIDFAGPFLDKMWLIVVDAQSKWPEAIQMGVTTTERTVDVLRSLFSRYGLPDQIVSDNGPQFRSQEFAQFCTGNGIKHTLVAPYHPNSNGEAERFVQSFKNALKAANAKPAEVTLALNNFLLRYRNTPHSATGKTPAELLMGRRFKTRLDLLRPGEKSQTLAEGVTEKPANARKFSEGDPVWVRNFSNGPKWLKGRILREAGPGSYWADADGQEHRRHIDHLRKRHPSPDPTDRHSVADPESLGTDIVPFPELGTGTAVPDQALVPPAGQDRYPTRVR